MKQLKITVCEDVEDACKKGFDYTKQTPPPKDVVLAEAVIVKGGMESGLPSVDLILLDAEGRRYVALVPGTLLSRLGEVINGC